MNGVERLQATVSGEVADRIPVFCNLFEQGARELNMPLREYFSRGEYVAEGQLWMRERLGYDNVWSLMYAGKEAEILGSDAMRFAADGPPNVEDFPITSPADVCGFEIPDSIIDHPAFQEERACIEILAREAKGKHVICSYVTGSMSLPPLLMGMDAWMELLFFGDAQLRDEMLTKCHSFVVKQIQTYRDLGADLLLYNNPLGSTDVVPPKFFSEQVLPWIERDMLAVGTADIVYYASGSRINEVIAETRDRTGIGVWYLGPMDNVAEAKQTVGTTGLTCGGINDIRLVGWSRHEIQDEVRRLIEAGIPGGPFLFGTGIVPYSVPDESLAIMLDAVYELGRPNGVVAR